MTVDLAVETALIRRAADVLDEASTAFDPGTASTALLCPLADTSLGATALARGVVGAASRRVLQAAEAARTLADLATDTAGRLRTTAAAFDAAESATIVPPR